MVFVWSIQFPQHKIMLLWIKFNIIIHMYIFYGIVFMWCIKITFDQVCNAIKTNAPNSAPEIWHLTRVGFRLQFFFSAPQFFAIFCRVAQDTKLSPQFILCADNVKQFFHRAMNGEYLASLNLLHHEFKLLRVENLQPLSFYIFFFFFFTLSLSAATDKM